MLRSTQTMRRAAMIAVLVLGGCGIDPQPAPPVIDINQLSLREEAGMLTLSGTIPEATSVRAIPFGGGGEPVDGTVNADGSFALPLNVPVPRDGYDDYLVRVQATNDDGRAIPVDVVPTTDGRVIPTPNDPLMGCVTLSTLDLDFGDVAIGDIALQRIEVNNACEGTMFFLEGTYPYFPYTEEVPTTEPPPPAFAGVHAYGIELPPKSSRSIALLFTPYSAGPVEEYQLVEVRNGPQPDVPDDPMDPDFFDIVRDLPITVRGVGR